MHHFKEIKQFQPQIVNIYGTYLFAIKSIKKFRDGESLFVNDTKKSMIGPQSLGRCSWLQLQLTILIPNDFLWHLTALTQSTHGIDLRQLSRWHLNIPMIIHLHLLPNLFALEKDIRMHLAHLAVLPHYCLQLPFPLFQINDLKNPAVKLMAYRVADLIPLQQGHFSLWHVFQGMVGWTVHKRIIYAYINNRIDFNYHQLK